MTHQEHSVWNNYSWEPKSIENENEPPLPAGGLNLPYVPISDDFYKQFCEVVDLPEQDSED